MTFLVSPWFKKKKKQTNPQILKIKFLKFSSILLGKHVTRMSGYCYVVYIKFYSKTVYKYMTYT